MMKLTGKNVRHSPRHQEWPLPDFLVVGGSGQTRPKYPTPETKLD